MARLFRLLLLCACLPMRAAAVSPDAIDFSKPCRALTYLGAGPLLPRAALVLPPLRSIFLPLPEGVPVL